MGAIKNLAIRVEQMGYDIEGMSLSDLIEIDSLETAKMSNDYEALVEMGPRNHEIQ